MENASKALIIAGAILISILLISVGVLIMNSINPMKDTAEKQSETMAVETFNAQFTQYEGSNIPASQVRSLFSKVNASNSQYDQDVTIKDASGNTLTTSESIVSSKKYTVTITSYVNGYVSEITVK